jgi:hypothetical protein
MDEVKGCGNSWDYKFRMHDARLGRFFAVDPLTYEYPHYTPYSFSGNKLISHREREGLEEEAAAVLAGPPGWAYIALKWTAISVIALYTYLTVEETVDRFVNAPALPETKRTVEGQPAPANAPRDDTKGKPEPKPEPKPIVPDSGPSTEEKKKDDPKYIYRGGGNTDKNYTP